MAVHTSHIDFAEIEPLLCNSAQVVDLVKDAHGVLNSRFGSGVSPEPLTRLLRLCQFVAHNQGRLGDHTAKLRDALWRSLGALSPNDVGRLFQLSDDGQEICLCELIGVTALHLSLALGLPIAADGRTAAQIWSQAGHDATRDKVEIGAYTLAMAVAGLRELRQLTVECALCTGYVDYVRALEFVLARYVFEVWPDSIADCRELRTPAGADLFTGSRDYIRMVCATYTGIYRRLMVVEAFGDVAPLPFTASTPGVQAQCTKLVEWLTAQCKLFDSDEPSVVFKELYPEMQLRPGDRELMRLVTPGIMPEPLGVLQEMADPGRMAAIMSRLNDSIQTIILKDIEDSQLQLGQAEPVRLGLCLYEFMNVLTLGANAAAFGAAFAVPELRFLERPGEYYKRSVEAPLLVQVFNHWQLLHEKRLYMHNSFLRSFIHLLQIMRETQAARCADFSYSLMGLALTPGTVYYDLSRLLWPSDAPQGSRE